MEKIDIDDLARQLADSLPEGLVAARDDLARNLAALLAAAFERLDLVTREEFDVQRKVLARTRERLESLEAELARLESESRPNSAD